MESERPPMPPFTTVETAVQKVRLAEDAWNTRDPQRVALAYALGSHWRNRPEVIQGRDKIIAFLALAKKGHDTRAIQGWLGHRSITSTAVYSALAPNRFKDFWRD
jgi:nuclear transport factor 2 (NTF2) superfamily protein